MKEFISKHKTKIMLGIICILLGIVGVSAAYIFSLSEVSYDNSKSKMSSTNVQGAIDELYGVARLSERMDELENNYWKTVYPVGSIYISTSSTNPSTLLGGTWVSYGSGRTLVGVNSSDSDFSTAEKTGGAKTHSIAVANLPVHNHSIPSLSGSTNTTGDHSHSPSDLGNNWVPATQNFGRIRVASVNSGSNYIAVPNDGSGVNGYKWGTTSTAGNHSHTVTTTASNTNGCTNCSGTALSTQDAYITVYMWKRTS